MVLTIRLRLMGAMYLSPRLYEDRHSELLIEGDGRPSSSEVESRLEESAGRVRLPEALVAEPAASETVDEVAAADLRFISGAQQNVSRFMSRQLMFS
jgi:hypothetical protein